MQNSVWKLTAIVGVVGIGFLVVLQAQRGLSVPGVSGPEGARVAGSDASAAADLGDAVAFDAFAEPEPSAAESATTIRQKSPERELASPFDGSEGSASRSRVPGGAGDPFESDFAANSPTNSPPRALTQQQLADARPVPTRQTDGEPQPAVRLASGDDLELGGLFDDPPELAAPESASDVENVGGAEPAAFPEDVEAAPAGAPQARQPRPAPLDPLSDFDPFAEAEAAPDLETGTETAPAEGESVPLRPLEDNSEPSAAKPEELDAGPDPFGADAESAEAPSLDQAEPAEPAEPQGPVVADDPFQMKSVEPKAAEAEPEESASTEDAVEPAQEGQLPQLSPIPDEDEDDAAPAPSSAAPIGAEEAAEPTTAEEPEDQGEAEEAAEPVAAPSEPEPLPTIEAAQPAPLQTEPGRVRLYERERVSQPDAAALPVISPARGNPQSAPAAVNPAPGAHLPGRSPIAPGDFPADGTVRADVPRGSQQPRLTIEKRAPPHAVLGQPLIYEIHVKNIGHSSAHQVVVEDRVPRGTQLTGSIPRAELVEKSLVWRFGELTPGEEQVIKVCVVPTTEGQVGSVATVNFVAEVAAETTITAPRLEMVLNGPRQVPLGAPVTFNFKVTNKGSGDATGVFVRSLLPAELRHPDGDDLEYEIGVLQPGKSRELSLSMRAAKPGEVVKHAILTADGGIEIEQQAALEIIGDRLVLSRKGPETRYLGRTATYSNTVANDGPRAILDAVIVESIPPGMEFVEADAGGTFDPEKRAVEWRIETLAPKERQVLNVTLKCVQIGEQQSLVRASSSKGGQAEVASRTEIEGFAALGLEIPTVDGPVDVGEAVTLRVQARNRGTVPSTNVRLTIKVPAELELVRIQGPAKYAQAGGQVRFEPVAAIGGGQEAQFELLLKARQPGNARVEVEIASDQLKQPLSREEIVYVLSPAG